MLENQKVLFKLIADLMKGGNEHVGKDFSQRLGDESHMECELGEGIGTSTGPKYVSGNQLAGNNLIISNAVGRTDTGTSYVSLDISGGDNSTGSNYVSGDQLAGNNSLFSHAVGRTDTGTSYVSLDISGGNNQHRALGDISNLVGRTNMGTNYVSMDHLGSNNQHRETNLSREHSFGEEGGQFMGEALVLKRTSCSVGNFAAKFLNVVFKSEELANRNCTGTRGKIALDPEKMAVIKKYVFKFYPCALAQEESTWRKCVVAIDEFLRRKKRDGGRERQD